MEMAYNHTRCLFFSNMAASNNFIFKIYYTKIAALLDIIVYISRVMNEL